MADPNAFTGALLDRASDSRRRDADWLAAQRESPAARAVVAGDAGLRADDGGLALVPFVELDGADPQLLLGIDADGPLFAVDEDDPRPGRPAMVGAGGRRGEPPPDAAGRIGLRDAATRLSQAEGGLAAYAASLLNWHRGHRFCANCGAATEPGEGGMVRSCPRCATEHHPRTDPVVIMLVVDGDRVLLGRQASWPARRYSALAGFVGPGESLEEAVRREVAEETGVVIGGPRYVSSQPWPFPASLMVGFEADWVSGDPFRDRSDDELQDARWFSRTELELAAEVDDPVWDAPSASGGEGLMLPPRTAIARRLVERWLGGQHR